MADRLTKQQAESLRLLRDMRTRYPDEEWDGATISDGTLDTTRACWPAFINWRTAYALERRGLVRTEYIGPEEGATITLTALGANQGQA